MLLTAAVMRRLLFFAYAQLLAINAGGQPAESSQQAQKQPTAAQDLDSSFQAALEQTLLDYASRRSALMMPRTERELEVDHGQLALTTRELLMEELAKTEPHRTAVCNLDSAMAVGWQKALDNNLRMWKATMDEVRRCATSMVKEQGLRGFFNKLLPGLHRSSCRDFFADCLERAAGASNDRAGRLANISRSLHDAIFEEWYNHELAQPTVNDVREVSPSKERTQAQCQPGTVLDVSLRNAMGRALAAYAAEFESLSMPVTELELEVVHEKLATSMRQLLVDELSKIEVYKKVMRSLDAKLVAGLRHTLEHNVKSWKAQMEEVTHCAAAMEKGKGIRRLFNELLPGFRRRSCRKYLNECLQRAAIAQAHGTAQLANISGTLQDAIFEEWYNHGLAKNGAVAWRPKSIMVLTAIALLLGSLFVIRPSSTRGSTTAPSCIAPSEATNGATNGEHESKSTPKSFDITIRQLTEFHKERGLQMLNAPNMGGIRGVLAQLNIDADAGVRSDEIDYRRQVFGENRVADKPPKSYLAYLWDSFHDFTILLLCACSMVSIVIAFTLHADDPLSDAIEGFAILCTVFFVCNIAASQDYSKEKSFRKLNADVNHVMLPVVRDGVKVEVLRYDLVVGDVVYIAVGDILEADGILIQGEDVEIDESSLTGEPEDIKKNTEVSPFLFSGTFVKSGSGTCLITAVGVNSAAGRITALIRGQKIKSDCAEASEAEAIADKVEEEHEVDETSVLRMKLDDMVQQISLLAFISAGFASVLMMATIFLRKYMEHSKDDEEQTVELVMEAIVTGIAIVVVAVPEGLPLAVTLSLALSVSKMQDQENGEANMVKHLDATETMGSATTICSDKTGTLTQNRMTVVRAYAGDQEFVGEHGNDATCGKLFLKQAVASHELTEKICEGICLNKSDGADIRWNSESDRWDQYGNKTDCALLAFAHDLGASYQEVRGNPMYSTRDPRTGSQQFGLKMYPFSSGRKRSGQAVPRINGQPNGPCRIYVKGASEMILKLCTTQAKLDGAVLPLVDADRQRMFKEVIGNFASKAMRTIGLAYRDFDSPPDWDEELDADLTLRITGQSAKTFKPETELTLLGILGIHDPIRDGVVQAIKDCNRAGIDVRMVTGDHKDTAVAIAKECGILRKGIDYEDVEDTEQQTLKHKHIALTGEEFRTKVLDSAGLISRDEFDSVWPHLRVLARSSPEDKYTLVSGMCESTLHLSATIAKQGFSFEDGQIVAVTGDGTNDAPALRRANVGFAMKITGTRVAQDAADILLLDDNFASVVKACKWGRNVYDSISKFLQFQLTVNIGAVLINVLGAISIGGAPMGVVQMLWVNMIMDSLGALALASEPPTEALLDRAPYGKTRGLISEHMWCNMLGQAAYQMVVLLLLLFFASGPGCGVFCDSKNHVYAKGGFLNIESGIGRGKEPTVHYTVIFNAFVFMQLFNWINCRKLHHELNPFKGILENKTFCIIWTICLVVQVLLVESARMFNEEGENMAVRTKALDVKLWCLCICFGAFSIAWQWVLIVAFRRAKMLIGNRTINAPKPIERQNSCDEGSDQKRNTGSRTGSSKKRQQVNQSMTHVYSSVSTQKEKTLKIKMYSSSANLVPPAP